MLAVPSTWQCGFKNKEPLGHLHCSGVPQPPGGEPGAWNIVIYCKLGPFRLMSCSPGVLSPGLRVVSPDWESTLILMFVGALFRTRNIHTPFWPVYFCYTHHYMDQMNIVNLPWLYVFWEPGKKDLFSILGRNDFILWANRLSAPVKRLRANRTTGETTWFIRPTWQSMVFQGPQSLNQTICKYWNVSISTS